MKRILLALVAVLCLSVSAFAQLSVCASNPRYFCEGGVPVLLTGSHVWADLYDRGAVFDYTAYLDFLDAKNHNFIRMWARAELIDVRDNVVGPEFPWLRTGPGLANDGQPRFDLTQPNPAFYIRLRDRVVAAQARGIYVGFMLFDGWQLGGDPSNFVNHPFHPGNNINGIDGQGPLYHTLTNPAVNALQLGYIHEVLNTLNDVTKLMYEVANESEPTAADAAWQQWVMDQVRAHETSLPLQHLAGMTWQREAQHGPGNDVLWASTADWIGPGCETCWGGNGTDNYASNPPADPPAGAILRPRIVDTDHIWGDDGGDAIWVWKCFLRGCNPILMDGGIVTFPPTNDSREPIRNAMGHALSYSQTIDLLQTTPQNSRASSGYALCSEFRCAAFAFAPSGNKFATVSVTMPAGVYSVNWLNPSNGQITHAGNYSHGGGAHTYQAPTRRTTYVLMLAETTMAATVVEEPSRHGRKK